MAASKKYLLSVALGVAIPIGDSDEKQDGKD